MKLLFFALLIATVQPLTHPPALLSVARSAAKSAGMFIASSTPALTETKANNRDLLTATDIAAQRLIKETIHKQFPSHSILGEEDVAPGAANSAKALSDALDNIDSDYLWIVDPLDGTTNFLHSLQHSAPSIAAVHVPTLSVVAAAIYDPYRDEMFSASLNGGAFLNGEKIEINNSDGEDKLTLSNSLVAMGSPPADESMKASMAGATALMPKVRSLRMTGSAALMLAYVGIQRFDSYWEYDLSSWDVSAGILFIRECGGDCMNFQSEKWSLTERKICAYRNGGFGSANELRKTLNDVGVM